MTLVIGYGLCAPISTTPPHPAIPKLCFNLGLSVL